METIQWSYSSLKDFIGCPKRYQETKVLKNYEFKPTEATIYGSKVHSALENYIKEGTPLPLNYQRFEGYVKALTELDGQKLPEHHMALDIEGKPCKWGAKERWVRGIADLLILNGNHARIVDYKTGSERYPDPDQLKLMALLTFSHYPEIEKIDAALFFIMHDVIVDESYSRDQMDDLWGVFYPHLERLKMSFQNDTWPENPTALCRFCPVVTCKFNKA